MGASRTEKRRWKLLRILRVFALAVLGLVVLVGSLAMWRLSRGPISLDRFSDRIEGLVDPVIAPLALDLGGGALVWQGWQGPLELQVRDVSLRRQDGGHLLTIDSASLAVEKRPLLRGSIDPVWLEIGGLQANLVRAEDGRIDLGLPEANQEDGTASPALADLAERWLAAPDSETPLGRLTSIRVREAGLRFEDRALGLTAQAHQFDLELQRGEALIEVSLPLSVDLDEKRTQLDAALSYRLDEGRLRASLEAPLLEVSALSGLHPSFEAFRGTDLSLAFQAQTEISDELKVELCQVDLLGDWGHLNGEATFANGLESIEGKVQVRNLEPWRFSDLAPELNPLGEFRYPVDADLEVAVEGGELSWSRFGVRGSEADNDWGEISGSVRFTRSEPAQGSENLVERPNGIRIGDTFSGDIEVERLFPWKLAGVAGFAPLEGIHLILAADAEFEVEHGELEVVDLRASSGGGEIQLSRFYDEPLRVRDLDLKASVQGGLETLVLEELRVDLVDIQPRVVGRATKRDDRYEVRATATLEALDVPLLPEYWPGTLASGVRKWIAEHIVEGRVRDVVFDLAMDFDPDAESKVRNSLMWGSMAFDDLELDLFPPKEPIVGIDGTATFEDWALAFDVLGGSWKELSIEGADVQITGLDTKMKRLDLELLSRLEVATAFDLLSGEPLDLLDTRVFGDLNGQTEATLQLGLKLSGPNRDIEYEVDAQVSELEWTLPKLGLRVGDGDLAVDVSREAVEVRGTIAANGIPAEVEYRQDLAGGDPPIDLRVQARLDEASLIALGLPEQNHMSGETGLSLHYSRGKDRLSDIVANVDFVDSRLDIAELDWQKAVGEEGLARVVVTQESERAWSVKEIRIAAGDLDVDGSFDFEVAPFRFLRVDLPVIELPDNQIRASLVGADEERFSLQIVGKRFHIQPALERIRKGRSRLSRDNKASKAGREEAEEGVPASAGKAPMPPIAIEVLFDELNLSPDVRLDGFEMRAVYDGDRWTSAKTEAAMENDGGLFLAYELSDEGYRLEARTDRAGEIVAGLLGFDRARGGFLEIKSIGASQSGSLEGRVELGDLLLAHEVVVARILDVAGLEALSEKLNEGTLKILDGHADFAIEEGVLRLRHGQIYGTGFLVSFGGTVDFAKREVSLLGAIAPMRRFQRYLGKVPLIGALLLGRNREGLIATHFTVEGSFDELEVAHVLFSTLTPGVLRDVLGISAGE